MANVLVELWWLLKHGRGWRDVVRVESHPRLGELRYTGRRSRPGDHVTGVWKLQPAGFDRPFGVDFPTMGDTPTPETLAQLEQILADLDSLFERARPKVRIVYERMVEKPLPAEWRDAFKLDHVHLPDLEEKEPEWQVQYWCEAALHWLVVDLRGDVAIDAEFEG